MHKLKEEENKITLHEIKEGKFEREERNKKEDFALSSTSLQAYSSWERRGVFIG